MSLGKPKDSVWEDWGTLGKIRETPPFGHPPPVNNPIKKQEKHGRLQKDQLEKGTQLHLIHDFH